MYSFLLAFWTLSFDIFTYNVYHMCVNLILTHIWDAFGFVLKIGCDIMAHICPSSTLLQFWKEASKYIWWFLRISQDSQWERKNLQWWRGNWAIYFQICWFFLCSACFLLLFEKPQQSCIVFLQLGDLYWDNQGIYSNLSEKFGSSFLKVLFLFLSHGNNAVIPFLIF